MNILLQHRITLEYVHDTGGWTLSHNHARHFHNWLEALMFCFDRHLDDMQILGEWTDSNRNFSFPVAATRYE